MDNKDMKILDEAQWASEHVPDSAVPQPKPDELEQILNRVDYEKAGITPKEERAPI